MKSQKEQSRQYRDLLLEKDSQIKKMEADIQAKNQQINYHEYCEDIADQIQEAANRRRKRETMLQVIKRAKQYTHIQEWKS